VDRADLTVLSASPACVGGGAERVAYSLHQEYLARGLDSWLAVATRNCDDPRVVRIPVDAGRSAWARALLRPARAIGTRGVRTAYVASRALRMLAEPGRYIRVVRGHEDFDFPCTQRILDLTPSPPDILHLHNLHGAWFDVRALPEATAHLPTMITLHDAWLLTGHCAYPLDCTRWQTGCGDCPYLELYVPLRRDESASNVAVKRAALAGSHLALACPSRWIYDMVQKSGVASDSVRARVVHNGIDIRIFKPADKGRARAELGLPADARILCFAARGIQASQFKGFGTLMAALTMLGEDEPMRRDTLLLALGSESADTQVGGIAVRFVPFVTESALLARYYQASDAYVHPARAETFGLAVAEAMACGLPVVASEVGGIPEIVIDGESGLLFNNEDPRNLANLLRSILHDGDQRARLGANGLERVQSHFTLDRQVDAYLGWYEELVAEWGR
jgi:glycosyltransferase involved in cell wall biosynthesis